MVSANPTEPASKRSSPFAAGGQQHDPHVSRITPASARPPRLSANQERGLHRHQRRSVCAQSHRHGSDRQTDRPERAPNSRRSGSPPSPECSRAAAFCRPSSARAETTPEAAATNANANRGHRLKLELKSVFQLAEAGCRCQHTQEDIEFQGSAGRGVPDCRPARSAGLAHARYNGKGRATAVGGGRLRRNRGDGPRAGARFLAGDAVRQRPRSPWPASLTVWQSTYFPSASPLDAPGAAPR